MRSSAGCGSCAAGNLNETAARARARSGGAQHPRAGAAHRRPARHVARGHRAICGSRCGAWISRTWCAARCGFRAAGGRSEGVAIALELDPRVGPDFRRCGSPAAGGVESAHELREVHAKGGRIDVSLQAEGSDAVLQRDGQRHRYRVGSAAARVRALSAGRFVGIARAWRAGHRACARASPH